MNARAPFAPRSTTRYNLLTNPPPSLARVVEAIGKNPFVQRYGYVRDKHSLFTILRSADAQYRNKDSADEARRFLLNTEILHVDREGYWFDADRAEHVFLCAEKRQYPEPLSSHDIQARIDLLRKRIHAAKKAALQSTQPTADPPPLDLAIESASATIAECVIDDLEPDDRRKLRGHLLAHKEVVDAKLAELGG